MGVVHGWAGGGVELQGIRKGRTWGDGGIATSQRDYVPAEEHAADLEQGWPNRQDELLRLRSAYCRRRWRSYPQRRKAQEPGSGRKTSEECDGCKEKIEMRTGIGERRGTIPESGKKNNGNEEAGKDSALDIDRCETLRMDKRGERNRVWGETAN